MAVDAPAAVTPVDSVVVEPGPGGIVFLILNRPPAFNALSLPVMTALEEALERIGADSSLRVVILGGRGRAFCAGHDLREMRANPSPEALRETFARCSRVMLAIARIPQPVIAKVHGIATAAGCQLVAACDLAVAAESARFAVSGVNLGLFCSTPMVALSRVVSRKLAMEMLLTGDFIDAASALRYGLVNRVVAAETLDAETLQLAARVAAKSPAAIALGKRLFYKQLEVGIEAAYQLAVETMTCNMLTEDAQAGIDAFLDKRPLPEWTGR
jgi:enoyl-CoA hydratase/carnithine racemase